MSGAALGVVHAGLGEAEFAVYGVSNFEGIGIFLAVILPPADRAQGQDIWRFECPVAATRASKTNRCRPHGQMDEFLSGWFTDFGLLDRFRYLLQIALELQADSKKSSVLVKILANLIRAVYVISREQQIQDVQSAPQGETEISCALSACNAHSV